MCIRDRKNTLIAGCIILILNGITFWFGGDNVAMVYVGAVLFGLTLTFTFTPIWGMVPDSIEYGEWLSLIHIFWRPAAEGGFGKDHGL